MPETEEVILEEAEKEPVPEPLPSDDTRVENMDISDEGEELAGRAGNRALGAQEPV